MTTDATFMERAISLARKSLPFAGVNPPVGAVLVMDGVIVGQGFHKGPGMPHAEAAALLDARSSMAGTGQSVAGATLYCSLEPCCHCGQGKRTPPCTEVIIAAGIARVVFASGDPNPGNPQFRNYVGSGRRGLPTVSVYFPNPRFCDARQEIAVLIVVLYA